MDEQDEALGAHMIKWNRYRRESGHVLAAHELLALGDLLRELDAVLGRYATVVDGFDVVDLYYVSEEGSAKDGIRSRLEKLLGMHPGSLDTSRDV